MSVPGAWLSPSHVCIVWCNQLLPPLTRAITNAAHSAWFQYFQNSTLRAGVTQPVGLVQNRSLQGDLAEVRLAPDGYDHADVFLSSARQQLRSSTLPARLQALLDEEFLVEGSLPDLQTEPDQTPEAAAMLQLRSAGIEAPRPAASHTLDQAISSLEGQGCYGANLMWYAQYSRPKDMTRGNGKGHGLLRLHGPSGAKKVQSKTGRLYRWVLPSSRCSACGSAASGPAASTQLTFSLVVSGSKPCEGFRLWLHRTERGPTAQASAASAQQVAAAAEAAVREWQQEQGSDSFDAAENSPEPSHLQAGHAAANDAAEAGEAVLLNAAIDVTHLAAWLPLTMQAARRRVRDAR